MSLQNVAAGSHTVTLKRAGYTDWQTITLVTAGQITQLSATLNPVQTAAPTKSGRIPFAGIGALMCFFLISWKKNR